MPRTARLYVPDGVFHLISRAVDHHFLFDGDAERAHYLGLLGATLRRTDARVLAWCVMSNHVHLVVQAGQQPLWRLMKAVHVGYANWKNHRDARIGPLFAGRYKAILVDQEEYLLELVRYVHLNPVRAQVVGRPEDSMWSSHRAYVGLEKAPPWLGTRDVLERFGDETLSARQGFADFVAEGIEGERSPLLSGDGRDALRRVMMPMLGDGRRVSDAIVGSEAFVAETMGRLGKFSGNMRIRPKAERERRRPPADRLIDLICEIVDVDRIMFDQAPKARGPRLVRQVLARIWVGAYRGLRVDLARELRVRSRANGDGLKL